jgi:hypothetical protein
MGKPRFPFPGNIRETVELLNASDRDLWNLAIVPEDEALHVYDGDQVMFVAEAEQEVLDFLAGAFLATYNGKGLDQIRTELAQRDRQPTE